MEANKDIRIYGTLVNHTVDSAISDNNHNDALAYAYQIYDDRFGANPNADNFQDAINKRVTAISYSNGVTTVDGNLVVSGSIISDGSSIPTIPEDDSSLQSDLNNLTERVDDLEDVIEEEITDRHTAIANEAEERTAADTLIQLNINDEVTNRISGDDALRQLVSDVDNSLINYYTKSETYTKSEVLLILSNIRLFQYTVVGELPEASVDTIGYIYLIPTSNPVAGDVKDEFITISKEENGDIVYAWELIGHTAISISGYSTTSEMNTAIENALSGYVQTSALSSYATTAQAVGDVSISGNTLTFTSISGATIATIPLPSLWTDNGTTLSPSTSGRSVTAAGFYDSTIN